MSEYAPSQHEIVSTRVFAAPREKVYGAFSNPAVLTTWWGPKGFTNTFEAFDLRPGGIWKFTMHGPDGTDYPNGKEFIEFIPMEKVSFKHSQPVHTFTMTLTWTPEGEGTRLTWVMDFESPLPPEMRDFILNANEENFDRLEEVLRKTP